MPNSTHKCICINPKILTVYERFDVSLESVLD